MTFLLDFAVLLSFYVFKMLFQVLIMLLIQTKLCLCCTVIQNGFKGIGMLWWTPTGIG